MTYFDIIFFAFVAGVILYKLRTVLGRKDLNDTLKNRNVSTIKQGVANKDFSGAQAKFLPEVKQEVESLPYNKPILEPEINDEAILKAISEIKKLDPEFSAGKFIAGAKTAFEMIINSFSKGDKQAIKNMLSDQLYKDFAEDIDSRDANSKQETTLVAINSSDIVFASISGKNAQVSIKFTSEQIDVTRNKQGEIIEGNPSQIINVVDVWTFARDVSSSNPNWKLISVSDRE